jgi:hypothetical protein
VSGPVIAPPQADKAESVMDSSGAPSAKPSAFAKLKPSNSVLKQLVIMGITCVAIFQAGRSIVGSVERQCYLKKQATTLKDGQKQAEEINKELRDGLTSYRSNQGIERLARERLNLAGPDEVVIRIGK